MFTIFKKKKLSEDQLAHFFVNSTLKLIDSGFEDVCEIINNDLEFSIRPNLNVDQYDQFLLIVMAGNIKLMSANFEAIRSARVAEKIYRKLSSTLKVEPGALKETISKYQSWMGRINHPSKNVHYSMSKGVFFKYNLNEFQTDYFKNMNTPNPIFLKRLDEIVSEFIFDWENLRADYRIVEG
jgi:hypothetical protein